MSRRCLILRRLLLVSAASLFLPFAAAQQREAANIAYIHTSNEKARSDYLARASIWSDPGVKTPEDILRGPIERFPLSRAEADAPDGFPCKYTRSGVSLGGRTQKFICETPGGQSLRLKYYSDKGGNREIFGSVASTRLLWALGFDADAVFPVKVKCLDCPEDPYSGSGNRATRTYFATVEPHYEGTLILSGTDPEQGWSWAELDKAIRNLPQGALRDRQRMHFDALALLGVLIQHGDRKPSQQRLVCRGEVSLKAGDVHSVSPGQNTSWRMPVLFERPGMQSCQQPVVTVQDVGATYGGAGRFTIARTSKMSLEKWASKTLFRGPASSPDCVGNLTISASSGPAGEASPRISEQGRAFLAQQLKKLTEAHLRALFTAARVELLGDENRYKDPETGRNLTGVDAWVAAFQRKVSEIDSKHCTPLE